MEPSLNSSGETERIPFTHATIDWSKVPDLLKGYRSEAAYCGLYKQSLSKMLDDAIIEAAKTDKRLLRGVYRELASRLSPNPRGLPSLERFYISDRLVRGTERVIEALLCQEAGRPDDRRAALSDLLLERLGRKLDKLEI